MKKKKTYKKIPTGENRLKGKATIQFGVKFDRTMGI